MEPAVWMFLGYCLSLPRCQLRTALEQVDRSAFEVQQASSLFEAMRGGDRAAVATAMKDLGVNVKDGEKAADAILEAVKCYGKIVAKSKANPCRDPATCGIGGTWESMCDRCQASVTWQLAELDKDRKRFRDRITLEPLLRGLKRLLEIFPEDMRKIMQEAATVKVWEKGA